MNDTTGRALDRYNELLEAQAPHERLAQAMALTRMVRELAVEGLRSRFPSAGPDELRARFAALLYGREVAERLYGEVPSDAD